MRPGYTKSAVSSRLRRVRQQEPDADRTRYVSRRLRDYEKAFRKQRAECYDQKAAERNSLGWHSKRQRSMQRGTLPTHPGTEAGQTRTQQNGRRCPRRFGDGTRAPTCRRKPRRKGSRSAARSRGRRPYAPMRLAKGAWTTTDAAHQAPTESCTGCLKTCRTRLCPPWHRPWKHGP